MCTSAALGILLFAADKLADVTAMASATTATPDTSESPCVEAAVELIGAVAAIDAQMVKVPSVTELRIIEAKLVLESAGLVDTSRETGASVAKRLQPWSRISEIRTSAGELFLLWPVGCLISTPFPTTRTECESSDEEGYRFLCAGNGGHYNRGCQAIELGTQALLAAEFGAAEVVTATLGHTREYDVRAANETRVVMPRVPVLTKFHPVGLYQRIALRVRPDAAWQSLRSTFATLDPVARSADAVMCLGGDNYTLDYGYPDCFMSFNEYVLGLREQPPLVLWGCSVGPFTAKPAYERMAASRLREVALILAREAETVSYLSSIGVSDNVHLIADPAFLMSPVAPAADRDCAHVESGSIGINLSPLAGRYAGWSRSEWTQRCVDALSALLLATDRPVALVPHVIDPPSNDDFEFMSLIAEVVGSDRLSVMARELMAPELKHVIGQCCVFVGARTHSTIAALGQCVPCGFIAYSSKAYGISRDMMGSDEWALPIAEFDDASFVELVERLITQRVEIRSMLSAQMPAVSARALSAGRHLRKVVDERRR